MDESTRKAVVMFKDRRAGIIEEIPGGYRFTYDLDYLRDGVPVAVSFPLQTDAFDSRNLFPFFKGLLPEGWYREIVLKKLKIDKNDFFGLLINACEDCIGAVWIKAEKS
ncbi:MAG: HipA N-terminal domain-containing protein [Deltaproteobacteria bacterium]|nr:HipA N-terminal domain-containing protein [Deltaproteobacteria bacterium]